MKHIEFEMTPMPAWDQEERPIVGLHRTAMKFVNDALTVALEGRSGRLAWVNEVQQLQAAIESVLAEEVQA